MMYDGVGGGSSGRNTSEQRLLRHWRVHGTDQGGHMLVSCCVCKAYVSTASVFARQGGMAAAMQGIQVDPHKE